MPLEDITHRFVQSPLPPSSSPALSYIDEIKDKQNPSSAFLALSTSPARPLALERDTTGSEKPTFEVYDEFDHRPPSAFASNPIFSTPTSKPTTRAAPPSPGDPFGFLAAERKLKLDRSRDGPPKRNPPRTRSRRAGQPSEPPEPDRRKRQKLDPSATPSKHVPLTLLCPVPYALPTPSTNNRPAKQKPTLRRVGNTHTHTQTPTSRPTADIRTLAPPPVTPLHDKKRKRRRPTALLPFDDEERNPFIVDSSDVLSTPSPVKRPSARRPAVSRYDGNGGDKVFDDENVKPFCTPTSFERGSMPPNVLSSAASPKRRRRKRYRAEEVEGLDGGDVMFSALVDDSDALARAETRTTRETVDVVTPVKKRQRRRVKQTELTRGKSDKEAEDADAGYAEDEENVKEVKGVRRSTRLSKQGPLADSNKGKKAKVGKTTTRGTKGKGKENAGRASTKAAAVSKGKGKAKDRPGVDEAEDDVIETVSFCLCACGEC